MNDWLKETNWQAIVRHIRSLEQHGHSADALGEAVRHGIADEIVRLIESGVDVNSRGANGLTPLMFANTPKVAKLLIDHGADVNARCDRGKTPLLWFLGGLVGKRTAEQHIRTLLAAGADVRVQSIEGDTPQALAEEKYGPEIARLLEPK